MKTTTRPLRLLRTATAIFGAGLLAATVGLGASAAKSSSLFSTDFSGGAGTWTVTSGTFQMEGGVFRSRAVVEEKKLSRAVVGEKSWSDYRVTARLKLEQAANAKADFGLMARYQDPNNYYIFLYKADAKKVTVETKIKGKLKTVAEASIVLESGHWHDFQVTVVGEKLSVTVDNKPLLAVTHGEFTGGPAGLLSFWADVQCYRFEVESVTVP